MPIAIARKIRRTFSSVLSAYPQATTPFAVRETARLARCSRSDVFTALGTIGG